MKSYDVVIHAPNDTEGLAYPYGDQGLRLGNALKEPTAPNQVDTIVIRSLHHGAGRIIATDPVMYRDTNGEQIGADARQPGYIMPGGALTLLDTIAIRDADNVDDLEVYGAAFTEDDGDVIFAVGNQVLKVAIADDTVSEVATIGENLITNHDFETDTTGWTTGGTNTLAASTEQFKFGAQSLKITYQDDDVLASYAITLPAADDYESGVWIYIPTNYDGTDLRARWQSFAGAGGTADNDIDMTTRDAWVFHRFATFTPVSGDLTGTWEIYENGTNATAGRAIYVDHPQIYRPGTAWFTGSVVIWGRDAWLGVDNADGSYGAYEYDSNKMVTDENFAHSWATSTQNAIYWIRNRGTANPQLRWSDRTDQDFDDIDPDPDDGFVFGPFVLEIEKATVTGMGNAGQFALFANRGGRIWGFDQTEVFLPLTPFQPGGYDDPRFGGPMQYIGAWMLVPGVDGLWRFDPRSINLADISPAVHQGSTPTVGTATARAAQSVAPTATGAVVFAPFLGSTINVLYLEMYEDGMFYHLPVSSLTGLSRVWTSLVTHKKSGDVFTSQLVCYFVAADTDVDNWKVYRLDLPTAGWQPGPANIAAESGLRTAMYTPRPPDVTVQPTQVRGYAQASAANHVEIFLEVDGGTQISLGRLTSTGPFALPVPSTVAPGRKLALAYLITVGDGSGTIPFIALDNSIDYRYAPKTSPGGPDHVTIDVLCSSGSTNKLSGRRFMNGRDEANFLVGLRGEKIDIEFADTETKWHVIVEETQAALAEREDGSTSGRNDYNVTLVCRRL